MVKKALITGVTGQDGSYLSEFLLDKGYEAEDFVTYLTSKKGDEGMNLMNWSFHILETYNCPRSIVLL